MPEHELSLIRYNFANYYAVLLNSRPFYPITTLLIKLAKALIESEPEPDAEARKKLDWISENTHEKVMQNLAVIELVVFKNLGTGISLSREVEIGGRNFYLVDLYKYLDEITSEITLIVVKTASRYSLDMPISSFHTGGNSRQVME